MNETKLETAHRWLDKAVRYASEGKSRENEHFAAGTAPAQAA